LVNSAGLTYLDWYYNTNVWKDLHYRGVRTLKLPLDMWNYQEIIFQNHLHWVIETGTRHGGSALFFADLLTAARCEGSVITIDVTHDALDPGVRGHPGIRFLLGDSAGEQMLKHAMSLVPAQRQHGLLLILDADHAAGHVFRELTAWVPLLKRGDYLVVEDTIVNGHPVRPEFGPGPMEAIMAYIEKFPGRLIKDEVREGKFGCTFAANGYYKVA
jgi:cephalosporin hydroxylase